MGLQTASFYSVLQSPFVRVLQIPSISARPRSVDHRGNVGQVQTGLQTAYASMNGEAAQVRSTPLTKRLRAISASSFFALTSDLLKSDQLLTTHRSPSKGNRDPWQTSGALHPLHQASSINIRKLKYDR